MVLVDFSSWTFSQLEVATTQTTLGYTLLQHEPISTMMVAITCNNIVIYCIFIMFIQLYSNHMLLT